MHSYPLQFCRRLVDTQLVACNVRAQEDDGVYINSARAVPTLRSPPTYSLTAGAAGFWVCIPNAIYEKKDADGSRVENSRSFATDVMATSVTYSVERASITQVRFPSMCVSVSMSLSPLSLSSSPL